MDGSLARQIGKHIVVAPPPVRVIDGTQYGPGLTARIVGQRCLASMALYRLAQSPGPTGRAAFGGGAGQTSPSPAAPMAPLHDRPKVLSTLQEVVLAVEPHLHVLEKQNTRRARGCGQFSRTRRWCRCFQRAARTRPEWRCRARPRTNRRPMATRSTTRRRRPSAAIAPGASRTRTAASATHSTTSCKCR